MSKDSNGNELNDGDTVILTKTLKVKPSSTHFKRGVKVKNIRLTNDDGEVECRTGKATVVLKSEL